MELTVWVEGIPRVVCGVNHSTTCQDVVLALAHATSKTGRFTLIEKWRDVERFLSPTDIPLKHLHKWGEYASDVKFILRHSDTRSRSERMIRDVGQRCNIRPSSATPGVKRSVTITGAHGRLPLSPTSDKDSSPCGSNTSLTSQTNSAKLSLGERDTPGRGSLDHSRSLGYVSNDVNTNSLDRQRRQHKQSPASRSSPSTSLIARVAPSSSPAQPLIPQHKASASLPEHDIMRPQQLSVQGKAQDSSGKEELLKLVNLQLERLEEQQQHISKLQSEINYIEEQDTLPQEETSALSEEIQQLEKHEESLKLELKELQTVGWEDKLVQEKERSQQLRAETSSFQQSVSSFEIQLQQTKDKLQKLSKELENNITREEKERQAKDKEEEGVRREIEELQLQLSSKEKEGSEVQDSLDEMHKEMAALETNISKNKAQIAELEMKLTETNLDQFKQEPGTEIVRTARERRSATDLLPSHRLAALSTTTDRKNPRPTLLHDPNASSSTHKHSRKLLRLAVTSGCELPHLKPFYQLRGLNRAICKYENISYDIISCMRVLMANVRPDTSIYMELSPVSMCLEGYLPCSAYNHTKLPVPKAP